MRAQFYTPVDLKINKGKMGGGCRIINQNKTA